jgi:hypothetical protein
MVRMMSIRTVEEDEEVGGVMERGEVKLVVSKRRMDRARGSIVGWV